MQYKAVSTRRRFLKTSAATFLAGQAISTSISAPEPVGRRVKVGVIGCGSVSTKYLPHLEKCPFVELVSTCDIRPERAKAAAEKFRIKQHYPHITEQLAGEPFELLINLTNMQEHYHLNQEALHAGKHVWSEKPMGNNVEQGMELLDLAKSKGLRIWGAPTVVLSPQFAFMAKTIARGQLGRIAAAHASYGHLGPTWSAFFYEKGGGSLPDLGVYNLSTLTGLLGPAKEVSAMINIITPKRRVDDKGEISVTEEDNAMVTLLHENGCLSHVQCGFNYFTSDEHDYTDHDHHTIDIVGTGGSMHLCGYDWAPHGVDLATQEHKGLQRYANEPDDYVWENGASTIAECLATGKEPLVTAEHAIHVLEIIEAAHQSQETGRRVKIETSFHWPVIG